jgi:hypothetical protein
MRKGTATASALTLLALVGCAKAPESGLVCGDGTVEEDGACVPVATEPPTETETEPPTGDDLECGEGTIEVDGECVSTIEEIVCGEGTYLLDGECVAEEVKPPDEVLVPGHYTAPLSLMQRLESGVDHMHIFTIRHRETDDKVFYCSYTFGVLDVSDPYDVEYTAELLTADNLLLEGERAPGCLHLDWHDELPDYVFTTHRDNIDFRSYLGAWVLQMDVDDPQSVDPYLIDFPLQEDSVSYEGIDYEGGYIYVTAHQHGLLVFTFDGMMFHRVTDLPEFEDAWEVQIRDEIAYIADGVGGLVTVDVSDPEVPMVMGRALTNGQALDVETHGDVAYVAAGAGGVAIMDITDPYSPSLVDSLDTNGMAVSLSIDSDRLYVAAWYDTRVYDISDPHAPVMIGAVHITKDQSYNDDPNLRPDITARTFGVDAFGDTVFVGNWWVPYTYYLRPEELAPYIVLPETVANLGFGPTKIGETRTQELNVKNQGTAPLVIYDAWVDNAAFTVSPTQVQIEPGDEFDLTLTYTATSTELESGKLTILNDDPNQLTREAWLTGNQPGLGVGSAMPEATGDLVDGTTWSYTEDALGSVTLLAYFATF